MMYNGWIEYPWGRAHYRDGKLHRDDGPAIERSDGYRAHYRDGKLHRDDGPAVEGANGSREWWCNGLRLDTYHPPRRLPDGRINAGCSTFTLAEARDRLARKPRPYAGALYAAALDALEREAGA